MSLNGFKYTAGELLTLLFCLGVRLQLRAVLAAVPQLKMIKLKSVKLLQASNFILHVLHL